MKHIRAGASIVVLSAPTATPDLVPTVVHGVSTVSRRPDRLLRQLHHQLHRSADGDSAATARGEARGHDDGARLHRPSTHGGRPQ